MDVRAIIKVKTKIVQIEISIWFLVLLPVIFALGYLLEYIAVFSCILLHELAHIAVSTLLGNKTHSVRILPVGLNALMDEDVYSRENRVAVYLSGPILNLLISMLCIAVKLSFGIQSDGMAFFILVNTSLALFNMLPVLPLDGGKVLKEILEWRFGLFSAAVFLKNTSMLMSLLLVTLGIIQLLLFTFNFSLILIGLYILFSIKSYGMEAAFMNIKNFVYRHSRLLKKGIYPARDLVVLKSAHLSEALKNMDFDRFHMVYLLDDHLRLIKIFTEQDIVDGLTKYGAGMTFGELIKDMSQMAKEQNEQKGIGVQK